MFTSNNNFKFYKNYFLKNYIPFFLNVSYYDEIRFAKKSCKKLKLEDLGYNCKDLESQTASRIDKIKGK